MKEKHVISEIFGRLVYVSCWTDKESESSSLWSEYTQKKGVRIKLPIDIFQRYPKYPIYHLHSEAALMEFGGW